MQLNPATLHRTIVLSRILRIPGKPITSVFTTNPGHAMFSWQGTMQDENDAFNGCNAVIRGMADPGTLEVVPQHQKETYLWPIDEVIPVISKGNTG